MRCLGLVKMRTLPELFTNQVAAAPGAVAVGCEDDSTLTYGELALRVDGLAGRLRQLGVGPEVHVAVAVERSPELVVSILAILRAGGAYVPLDPAFPPARAAQIVKAARCTVAVCDAATVALLPEWVLRVDPQEAADGGDLPIVAPAAAAYVIFTSGSTGTPKGVVVTHENVVRLLEAVEDDFDFDERDVWAMFHSVAFDFSVWELWGALRNGGRVEIVSYRTSRTPDAFFELLRRKAVTVLNQTPTAFLALQRSAETAGFPPTSLRWTIFGGEALNPRLLRPWLEAYGDDRPRLVNMYGITETTVHVTHRRIGRADVDADGSPIGSPLSHLQLHLLHPDGSPVPPGEQGEICVGGAGVARGYLDDGRLTAARFVPDPLGLPSSRLYRSGDLGVVSADGELWYLGRSDAQVKVRGFRIELGEVEAALARHPAVRMCAVTTASHDDTTRLVAYVVGEGAVPAATELHEFLARSLPEYMVPAVFVPVHALPLTENGKLDRRALRELGATAPFDGGERPTTEREKHLAAIWARVLRVDRVSRDASFFALGGDSILALQTVNEASAEGFGFSMKDLYRTPTVEALAQHVADPASTAGAAAPKASALDLPPGVDDAFPLSSLQLGMIYETEFAQSFPVYHDIVAVSVVGPFSAEAMRAALAALVARHELLRVSFELDAVPEPRQLVHRAATPLLEIDDSSGLSEQTQASALAEWRSRELQRPFRFEQPCLLRCHVAHAKTGFTLELSTHHAILDGWSLARAVTDLLLLYDRELGGHVVPEPPPAISYRTFVERERETLRSTDAAAFWREVVAGADARLPQRRTPGGPSTPHDRTVVPVEASVLDDLRAVGAAASLPLKHLATAAHFTALAETTGRANVTSGVVVHERPQVPGAERLLGLFLNSVPMRVDVADSPLALARAVLAAEVAALPHRLYPLAELQRRFGHVFDVLFNYVHFHVYAELQQLTTLQVVDSWDFDRTNVPLTVEFLIGTDGDDARVTLTFDRRDLDEEFVGTFGARLVAALERIAAESGKQRSSARSRSR
jgi:amino acid adenylation domain-containing protein